MANALSVPLDYLRFIQTANNEVKCKPFLGTRANGETIVYAINAYGFLVKSVAPKELTFFDFVEAITEVYDTSNPQTAAVIRALNDTHAYNQTACQLQANLEHHTRASILSAFAEEYGYTTGFEDKDDAEMRVIAFNLFKAGRIAAHSFD